MMLSSGGEVWVGEVWVGDRDLKIKEDAILDAKKKHAQTYPSNLES